MRATKVRYRDFKARRRPKAGYPQCYPQIWWTPGTPNADVAPILRSSCLLQESLQNPGDDIIAGPTQEEAPLFSIIQAAGWPIWPLILCSIVALALVIERLSSLRTARVTPPRLLDEVLSVTRASLPGADVVNKLAVSSVLGHVLAAGVRSVVADPRITEEGLRMSFESAGRTAAHRLERYLNTLGTIATAAPLLGLFGTVVGMIEIFGSQAPTGGSNPTMLAHGISVALYNTAFGLVIAIPALMFYRYFRGKVDEFILEIEQAAERMVPHLMRFVVRGGHAAA
jgi:biopolymer transport protein ExbB